jgi:lipopolysaccharide export system ATP-binding protein
MKRKMQMSSDEKAVLGAENLKKVFGKKTAVRDISFRMEAGEIVGLLGPNGAGKTTTFYMVAGFINPTGGKIYLNDHDISKAPMYKRAQKGIAYLPQEASIFRKLSVEDNVMAVLETRKDLDAAERKLRCEELLTDLGIIDRRKQQAFTLSGGERRRTEIARALAIQPKFLLLDEPFAGIDPIAVAEIKKIILQLAEKGIGILITDHNVRDTMEITMRSLIINMGEIIAAGSREDILASSLARELYLGHTFEL